MKQSACVNQAVFSFRAILQLLWAWLLQGNCIQWNLKFSARGPLHRMRDEGWQGFETSRWQLCSKQCPEPSPIECREGVAKAQIPV